MDGGRDGLPHTLSMSSRRRAPWSLAFFAIGCAATEAPPDQAILALEADGPAPGPLTPRTIPGYMLEQGLLTDPNARIECPPNSRESGGRCFSTSIECPHGSRRDVPGGKCIAEVACPPGSEWSGFTCAPIADETKSTVLPAEALAPKPPTTGPTCTLFINSVPSSIPVVDGRPLPGTPAHVVVSAGVHSVTFIHPERGRKRLSVRCNAGERKPALVKFD